MADKRVNVILSLKDRFTSQIQKAAEKTKDLDKDTKRAMRSIQNFGKDANKHFLSLASGAAKASAALSGLAIGAGINEALNMEGYKTQLETATKDTKKAAEIMQYSIKLANKTPFEGGQLVEAAAKFEAMGMSAEKWLTITGDMAAATNKDFDQATEALIDAQTGELERLKEFGITKAMITKKANEMFTDEVVNNQGQIVDLEKFNEALVALMQDKYEGGMDKLAKTVRGRWSTVTGITKSALATMAGVSADGSVRVGSALDIIGNFVQRVADKLTAWQEDGTLDAIAVKFDSFVQGAVNGITMLVSHFDIIAPVIAGVVTGFAAFNILTPVRNGFVAVSGAIKGASTIMAAFNAVMALNPIGAVALAIGALIAILILLKTHWTEITALVTDGIKKMQDGLQKFAEKLSGIKPPEWLNTLASGASKAGSVIGNALNGVAQRVSAKRNATGTSYFAGGATSINEGGRGEIVNLPNGTQIIPHDVAVKGAASKKQNISVSVNIAGNVIGNREYVDYMGKEIVGRLQLALANS